jgi:hypothetical protein
VNKCSYGCANTAHYKEENGICVPILPCEERSVSEISPTKCGDECVLDESLLRCSSECDNPSHYEKKNGICVEIKECENRIINESSNSGFVCGSGECYWSERSEEGENCSESCTVKEYDTYIYIIFI